MSLSPAPSPSPAQRPSGLAASLPNAMPEDPNARLLLFAFRRLGANGLNDAHGAQALFHSFGAAFRRPLLLLRTMMADLAHSATCPIAIAPCCCLRMTSAEAAILTIVARAETAPETARLLLGDLIGVRRPDGVLASVTALAQAFADAGRPVTG
ncbi:hypothetical protein GCM10008023_06600 [Sphingomonas glacialis]|uniref:Uncharacterized protein n=1 Tax=Sphingomonas glacialis TaxID=658225 RepID=A0ABQ3LFM1_9SPHN|nr:DUF6628 family protein [Sphingomonas glacialis]GHH09647.1 hypothetical protein GCM10008023_06600 [Sphingomonas glacialis]